MGTSQRQASHIQRPSGGIRVHTPSRSNKVGIPFRVLAWLSRFNGSRTSRKIGQKMSVVEDKKTVVVEVPAETRHVIACDNGYKKWAYDHAYLLGTLAAFFVITWIVEVAVNIVWK